MAEENEVVRNVIGPVTAYADAVAGGYTGTYEEWQENMRHLGDTAEAAAESANAAANSATSAAKSAGDAEASAAEAERAAQSVTTRTEIDAHNADPSAHTDYLMRRSDYDPDNKRYDVYAYADTASSVKVYGVSGVGGASTTLTRTDDAVGMTAMVGTDEPDENYHNDFDDARPFRLRKCVGTWTQPDEHGRCQFEVASYLGDPDYTEDGSNGDYVAVEIPACWTKTDLDSGTIQISDGERSGFKPDGAFVRDDGSIISRLYVPAYAMGLSASGAGNSLAGYDPAYGSYYYLRDIARKYNPAAGLEPWKVRLILWKLMTVEFATTDVQTVMNGATSMPYSNAAAEAQTTVATYGELDNNIFVLPTAAAEKYTVGQIVGIGSSAQGEQLGRRRILAINDYDADNKGIVLDGAALDIPSGTWLSTRPYRSGDTSGVLTPSGSPVSNTDARHPEQYRYIADGYDGAYSTIHDLFNTYINAALTWYHLTDRSWMPTSSSSPSAVEIASGPFRALSVATAYKNGYISMLEADADDPDILLYKTQNGSGTTYYADYLYISNSPAVRAVRSGGTVDVGRYFGPLYSNAFYAPSLGPWYFAGRLYLPQ